MSPRSFRLGLAPRGHRVSVLPATAGGIVILLITMLNGSDLPPQSPLKSLLLIGAGFLGILYLAGIDPVIVPLSERRPLLKWLNAALAVFGLLILTYAVPAEARPYVGILMILAALTTSVIAERGPAYLVIGATLVGMLVLGWQRLAAPENWPFLVAVVVMSLVSVETVLRLKHISRGRTRQLETIAEFSRHITSTLDKAEVMNLLSAAFQKAIVADTYFVGMREGDELRLDLIYDDGEYFDNQRVKLEGSLSSWVITHQKSLFLPDLRKEVDLPGVRLVLAGKHKTSLSWLGVPMRSPSIDGIIAIGSYRPHAFDHGDLELLSTLAQHAAQALDNTYQHEQVELRSQLDSLTGIYNHGSFLRILQEQIDKTSRDGASVGLIMLDVDHFKRYNDSFGHLVGDEVLRSLASVMKQQVRDSDAVGRWGGEEFAIAVRGTSLSQLHEIALRIQERMGSVAASGPNGVAIPKPTVSQGLAVCPQESTTIGELIHLADQRLYAAKERGGNQIRGVPEPRESEQLGTASRGAPLGR